MGKLTVQWRIVSIAKASRACAMVGNVMRQAYSMNVVGITEAL